VKPSTSTGPDKLPVEPPTANIKPLGPAVNKPQPVRTIFLFVFNQQCWYKKFYNYNDFVNRFITL